MLFESPPSRALDISAQEAAAVGALAKGLVGDLDARPEPTDRLLAQRWLRIALVIGVLWRWAWASAGWCGARIWRPTSRSA